MYCVYLTIYKGNKLPPFYIGSTSIEKIYKGYKGSVESKKYGKIWKNEIKNCSDLFCVKIISVHNTREEAYDKELKFLKHLKIQNNELYVNIKYNDSFRHIPVVRSKEYCKAISESLKGRKLSEEHRIKCGNAMKGKTHSKESIQKQIIAQTGKKRKPFSEEHRRKISEAQIGRKREFSEEHKQKLKEAWKIRKNRK